MDKEEDKYINIQRASNPVKCEELHYFSLKSADVMTDSQAAQRSRAFPKFPRDWATAAETGFNSIIPMHQILK